MKKTLMMILLLMTISIGILPQREPVEAATSSCTTNRTVFVHYHRWDETYDGTTIWTWSNGTNGTGAGTGVVETDDFGAVYQICVDDDADTELGLILKYGDAWGDGFDDRDAVDVGDDGSKDGDHKLITIKDETDAWLGFDENGVKHVYVFEGSNQVMYEDDANSLPYSDDLATIAVIYSDPTNVYEGWDVWTWNTGTLGSVAPVPLLSELGVDGGIEENMRVSFINVDTTDMGTEIGYIMRTEAWDKKCTEGDGNILVPTTGLVPGAFVTYFYVAGDCSLYDNFAEFDQVVNFFEITEATALDPNSLSVMFNKEVATMVEGSEVISKDAFTVTDKDGNVVSIESLSYTVGDFADEFTLLLDDALEGAGSPYTVSYQKTASLSVEKSFDVDNTPPVINITGAKTISINTGDTYSLPNYDAYEQLPDDAPDGTEPVPIYDVKVKDGHGTVDTREAGVYEVIIRATDAFNNVTEEIIEVTVVDICAVSDAEARNDSLSLASTLSLIFGGIFIFGTSLFTKKTNKKRVLIFLLVGLSTITLAGCKQEDPCDNNAENGILYEFDKNQTEIVEIKFWHDQEEYALAVIDAFHEQYPDIRVRWEDVNMLETHQRMELYSGSDYQTDVAFIAHNVIGSALNSNLLYPFPNDLRQDLVSRMVSSAITTSTSCWDSANNQAVSCESGNYESELFGAPMTGESVALFYNKTLLQELNGSPDPEETMEEILAHAATFNTMDDPLTVDVDETRLILTHPVNDAYFMHGVATAFGFDLFGETHMDPNQVNLDSQEMVNALTWIQDVLAPASGLNATTQTDNYQSFFENGNAAYMINGPWAINAIEEASQNNNFEWGITKLPTINGNDMISFSGLHLAVVSKETKNPTAAFKFVEFLSSDEGLAIFYDTINRAPALKDASNIPGLSDDEYLSGVALQIAYSEPMPIIKEMGFYWANAMSMYVQAWDGTKTPQEAADTAQEGYEGQAELGSQ